MSEMNESGKRGRDEDETEVEAPAPKATKSAIDAEAKEDETTPANQDSSTTPPENPIVSESSEEKPTSEAATKETEAAVDDNSGEAAETHFLVDRKGEETEDPKDQDKEEGTGSAVESVPVALAAETNNSSHENPPQNAPPPIAADSGTLPTPIAAVNPTVQATIVNPDQIVEERGEIPALYVGKVIGKVRLQSTNNCFEAPPWDDSKVSVLFCVLILGWRNDSRLASTFSRTN